MVILSAGVGHQHRKLSRLPRNSTMDSRPLDFLETRIILAGRKAALCRSLLRSLLWLGQRRTEVPSPPLVIPPSCLSVVTLLLRNWSPILPHLSSCMQPLPRLHEVSQACRAEAMVCSSHCDAGQQCTGRCRS